MADHKRLFNKYLKNLTQVTLQQDWREESFYPVLADMLVEMAQASGRSNIHVTTLPAATDAGNPDFRIWNGTDRIIGYIEAKRPTEERLDSIENSEQLLRYRTTFPNLILTNFLEFRLYRNGERMDSVTVARPMVLNQLHTTPPVEKAEELYALLQRFLDFSIPKAFTAESLAMELAKRTRFMRDVVARQLQLEIERPNMLASFFEAFRTYLIGTLSEEDFADLFAQTITYGLFAARTRAGNGFNRRAAFDNIPHTIGVLRDLFRFISLGDPSDDLAWCIDDIAEVLAVADAPGILERYYREGKGGDPIVHFYETFLERYDPEERERRGVYYTPEPVVSYIVRSLNDLLKTEFGKTDGLASDGVTLLDPAAGTMTFVARAAQEAVREFESHYGSGARGEFIRRHILSNFYAFELMMAPYAVGHLKMNFFLEELGHRLHDDERVKFYLTNTFDMEELEQSRLPGFVALADESRLAGEIKQQTPVLVILGNPPYSGESCNQGDWIRSLIEDYKRVDGQPLGEKNPKWLQDDYVKFLRFAQWKIERSGCGVVGMITNHAYLDNPTFRGMRQSLMETFDEIHILNLHGNSLKREICPDGGRDSNVFDIRQGVAIAFFIKRSQPTQTKKDSKKLADVHFAEIWGLRNSKYAWLEGNNLGRTEWRELHPSSPLYLFTIRDDSLETDYRRSPSLPDIFPVNSVGIVTARDKLTIHWSAEEVWQTVNVFSRMEPDMARQGYNLGRDSRDWSVTMAQEDLRDSGIVHDKIAPILYRPFDIRYTYYTGRSRGFLCMPRTDVMWHMLEGENMAIISPKRVEHVGSWQHTFVTDIISDHVSVSLKTIDYHFPLYVYENGERIHLFNHHKPINRSANLNPDLIESLSKSYGFEPSPEEIFRYVYAILHSTLYRAKYEQFLKSDFPRIPFTTDGSLFREFAEIGYRLVALHLLRTPELDVPACKFEGTGDRRILKGAKDGLRYVASKECVQINATQYFAPVTQSVWEYKVGGYQVCEKWIKDRRGRRLELEDIRQYCRIVTALGKTMEIEREIDLIYPLVENDTIEL